VKNILVVSGTFRVLEIGSARETLCDTKMKETKALLVLFRFPVFSNMYFSVGPGIW